MREILFRGFREAESGTKKITVNGECVRGEWVYGSYFCLHHNDERTHLHHFIIPENTPIPVDMTIGEIQVEVIEETVGEFTGVLDMNETKVFEGDKIAIHCDVDYEEMYTVKYYSDRGYPAFDCTPYIDCDSNGLAYLVAIREDDETFEVIGTIYDEEDDHAQED